MKVGYIFLYKILVAGVKLLRLQHNPVITGGNLQEPGEWGWLFHTILTVFRHNTSVTYDISTITLLQTDK